MKARQTSFKLLQKTDLPRIDGKEPVNCYIIVLNSESIGMV
jgi:hypothetical protein